MTDETIPAVSDEIINLANRYADACKAASANVPISVYRMHFREFFDEARKILTRPAALAAQGQEPVAWRVRVKSDDMEEWTLMPSGGGANYLNRDGYECQPLYRSAITAPAQPVGVPEGWLNDGPLTPEEAWTILCETPDITSPAEYPDHALITLEQLAGFMQRSAPQPPAEGGFQVRVSKAHGPLFDDDPTDVPERRSRFFEEAAETCQSFGMTREEAHQLVDYTFSRAPGEPAKEIGAAALTLASLCVVSGHDMMKCAEADLEKLQRPETIARIRAKRATRHGRGPLPGFDPLPPAPANGGEQNGS